MQLTYLDHLKATYSADGQALTVQVGRPTKEIGSPLTEARRAARLIRESAEAQGQTLWLCMSGGIDSEAMARAFLIEGIAFRVAILRFHDDLNWHDIENAVQFCHARNLDYEFFDLDILNFFEQGKFLEIAKKYRCRSPQIASHLYLLSVIPGFPVLSWNPTSVQWVGYPGGKIRLALPSELHFSYHRFFKSEKRGGVGFFFAYTPELFYSFFHTPSLRQLLHQQGEYRGSATTYLSKCKAYREGGLDVEPRLAKGTGFEKIHEYYQMRFKKDLQFFDLIFRTPLESLYPDPPQLYVKLQAKYLPPRFDGVN